MTASGGRAGQSGWISVRPRMDGPTRARIVLGSVAVLLAALASLALLNVLLEEPLPVGTGDGDRGGNQGGPINFQPPDDPGQNESGEDEGGGGEGNKRKNPCDAGEPLVRGVALATTVIAMGLWVIAVWWRQARQTRVMNGFAIFALLVTLVAVTALFAWWIVHKVCSLDVLDLKSCLEIAHGLRNAFFFFLVAAAGLFAVAFTKMRKGGRFWGLWSIAGSLFVYLVALALVGWIVADDVCDKRFKKPDPKDLPNGQDPGGGEDPGNDPGQNNQGNQNNQGGGNPNFGGGGSNRGGGGGGGGAAPALPQVSPFALLVVLGIAAIVTVLVLAVKGRQDQQRAMAMAALEGGRGGMLRLFSDTDIESNDAVVAAYRRFLDHCLLLGVAKKPNETPREHGKRAAGKLALPYEEMLPLLDAYAHIRLANAPLPDEHRQAALSLARLWRPRTVKARRVRKQPGGGP